MIVAGREQIHGWKEIAAYLARDERTVKRWEKQRGLPVRRIPGQGRANVYINIAELEAWLTSRQINQALPSVAPDPPSAPTDPTPSSLPASDPGSPPDLVSSLPSQDGPPPRLVSALPEPASTPTRPWPLVTAFAALLLAVVAATLYHHYVTLASAQRAGMSHRTARAFVNPTAHELYLKGVLLYEERTPRSLEQARHAFEAALAADPHYASAYSGLACTFLLLREYSTFPNDQAYQLADQDARQALSLDPSQPEAHAALGFIDFFSRWNADAATREFTTALRLDPGSALSHHWYGSMLTHEARFAEALQQLDQAESLQPNSSAILASRAFALGLSGHRDQASELLRSLLSSGFDDAQLHRTLAVLSLVPPRNPARYLDEMRRVAELRNDAETIQRLDAGRHGLSAGGERGMWSAMLAEERRSHPSEPEAPTYSIAIDEAALGQADAAFRDLILLSRRRDPALIGLALDPVLMPLRTDPRFRQLTASAGLPLFPKTN